ncbi:helix-turn-helix domain-containing protein [Tessaracoccus flavescens]|uniref:DNA-binding protein n=1 Tax=Tessaracoccus flavescens TaxID=399497 RepID=A0A1Q2CZ35_9ACTN|nr:helix-turn-helix domain-containing protein [Tessaracoccus flavescens]AQP51363.1 DNA-binding protein [Tessaracoccus flavescens]
MFDQSRGVLFPSRLPAFHRLAPPHAAEDLVQWFWIPEWNLDPGVVSRQTVVGYPALNLVVEPQGVSLVGATTRMSERILRGSGWAVGALLRPAAVRTLTADASSLVDTEQPLSAPALHDQVGAAMGSASNWREEAVDVFARWFSARVGEVSSVARHANMMSEVLIGEGGANTPAEAAARLAVSLRTLQRMTHRYIGLPPAAIIRRRRLQDAAQLVREQPEISLATIAADLGYTDHAHLTGDFRSVLGFTPSGYRSESS